MRQTFNRLMEYFQPNQDTTVLEPMPTRKVEAPTEDQIEEAHTCFISDQERAYNKKLDQRQGNYVTMTIYNVAHMNSGKIITTFKTPGGQFEKRDGYFGKPKQLILFNI